MKDTIYFCHDYDAHNDPKIIKLRSARGREAYGLFRACLEVMRTESDIVMKEADIDAFAFRLQYERNALLDFMHFCVEVGLFEYDGSDKLFYSKRLQEDVEFMRNKSKKAKKAANTRWKARSNANALQTQSERNAIKERRVDESKGKEIEKKSGEGKILSEDKKEIDPLEEFVKRRNSSTLKETKVFPQCRKITDDMRTSRDKIIKSFTFDEIIEATRNYVYEISKRKDTKDEYYTHRFTIGEFIKQSNGARKFYNYNPIQGNTKN